MESTTMGIMNEVDELLGKLDNLPADVRIEVLRKLSQKVSVPQVNAVRKYKGRTRGRGSAKGAASSERCDALIDEVTYIKEETQEEPVIPEVKVENSLLNQNNVVIEVPSIPKKRPKSSTEGIIVTGRRQTKKVDYKQLSEYGHDDEIQEDSLNNDDSDTKLQHNNKRGRGRPKKIVDVARTSDSEVDTLSYAAVLNLNKDQHESEKEGSYDLLESCLKESGIKSLGEKADEQEKDEKKELVHKDIKVDENDKKGPEKKVYVCDTLDSINNVPKKKTGLAKYKCEECGKMYSSSSVLKSHQIRHRRKEDLPFSCNYCEFKSASKIEQFRHTLKHEKSLVYTCSICNRNFSRDTGLREHVEYVHARTQILKCGICKFSTHRPSTMRNHLLTHQGTEPVIACPLCGVTFRSKTNLRTHLYSHAGLKRFKCDECDKKFISHNRVKAHKLHVHGPREHNCLFCEMKFPTRHALNRHILVHTGEKPFQCCFCAFTCNTQGNLIKHIRQVHEKISFTYKDFLRESQKEQQDIKMDSVNLEKIQKEGKDFARKLFHTLGESLGETLTLEQLKEDVQKKRDSKVAALQEQQTKRKRKVLKNTFLNSSGKDRKFMVYSVTEKSGETVVDSPEDEHIYVEEGLSGINDDNACWLTHTDENGCMMLIPWDVSLISENDEEEEEGEWRHDLQAQAEKIAKGTNTCGAVAVQMSKNDDISISNIEDDCNVGSLESALEISRDIKETKIKSEIEVRDSIMEESDLSEVVNTMNPLDVDITIETSSSISLAADKKLSKQLPKAIQVITANESVNNTGPGVSNFVLPEGYIVDDDGHVLQITDNIIDTNLLQLQMGQVVNSSGTPEVTINKITNSVYSLVSESDDERGETFVITTREKEATDTSERAFSKTNHQSFNPNVNLLSVDREEDEGDQQSALVLIVDAEDVE